MQELVSNRALPVMGPVRCEATQIQAPLVWPASHRVPGGSHGRVSTVGADQGEVTAHVETDPDLGRQLSIILIPAPVLPGRAKPKIKVQVAGIGDLFGSPRHLLVEGGIAIQKSHSHHRSWYPTCEIRDEKLQA